MPASSDRLGVSSLRPWKPAENEPAEPKALTQSLQLTCSLTPSSTEPSTRLVTIWLKRCWARPLIDWPLVGVGVGTGVGLGEGEGDGDGEGLCAKAVDGTSVSEIDAASSAQASSRVTRAGIADFAMVSVRTGRRGRQRP